MNGLMNCGWYKFVQCITQYNQGHPGKRILCFASKDIDNIVLFELRENYC
jgi:hypothetical protein